MSKQPDFAKMTRKELRSYVLKHRTNEAALQAFLDKARAENPNPRQYGPDDNISDAIDEYLNAQKNSEERQQLADE